MPANQDFKDLFAVFNHYVARTSRLSLKVVNRPQDILDVERLEKESDSDENSV